MARINIQRKDVIWSYLGNFFKLSTNIILLPIILKLLPGEDLGLWYVYATISQLVVLLDFGFAATLARNITYTWCGAKTLQKKSLDNVFLEQNTDWASFKSILETCKFIYIIISSVALVLLLTVGTIYIQSLDSSETLSWVVYAASVFLNLLFCYYTSFLRGIGAIAENNKAGVISKIAQVLFSLIFLCCGLGLLGLSLGYLLSGLTLRVVSRYYFLRYENIGTNLKLVRIENRFSELIKNFKIVWYNASRDGLVTLSNYLSTQANTLLCSSMIGLNTTGAYGLSVQLSTMVGTLACLPYSTYLPKLQEYAAKQEIKLSTRLFSSTMFLYIFLFCLLSLGCFIFLPVVRWLKPSLPFDNTLLLGVLIYSLIYYIYHNFASYISTYNTLPYTKAFIVSSILSVLGSYLLLKYTNLDVWALIVAPLAVSICYNIWKWPKYILDQSKISLKDFISTGYNGALFLLKDIFRGSTNYHL